MRLSLYIFFVWFILEGAVRKWFLTSYSSYIFFVKYFLLLIPCIHVIKRGLKLNRNQYPFIWIILLYIFLCILETLNPRGTTDIRVKILGLLLNLSFIPLIYFVPIIFFRREQVKKLFLYIAIISIPIFLLGIYQYYSPPEAFINKYVVEEAYIAKAGGRARITGVFSYITPYSTYIIFCMMIFLTSLLSFRFNKSTRILIMISAILGMLNAFMTGSRGTVLLIVIMFIAYFLLYTLLNKRVKKKYVLIFILFALSNIIVLFFTNFGMQAQSGLRDRLKDKDSVWARIESNFSPFRYLDDASLFGYGLGTTYQGASHFVSDWGNMPRDFEEENERVLLETGLIGFVILLMMRLIILLYSYNIFHRIKSNDLKLIAIFILIYQIPIILGFGNAIYNAIQGAIYWFSIGLLVAIGNIDKLDEQHRTNITSR